MEKSYTVTFFTKEGRRDSIEVPDMTNAERVIQERLTENPLCCAHVLIKEYEIETPNKYSAVMKQFQSVNGHIIQVPY